ncbi:hypothetical protein INR49_006505 [Caranx melampygus]|nr:hypothetical protein INR49_006505 [Caranx melampygus]
MTPTITRGMFYLSLLLFYCHTVSMVTITTERRAVDGDVRTLTGSGGSAAAGKTSNTLFLLTGYKPPPLPPAGPKVPPKAAEVEDGPPEMAELPPKPLPQTMLPRNMTADALKPPLGAAQVAPPPRQLVDVDVCRGYFDVMGHFDSTFNCSQGSYIYCCGTCHYRFCCEHRRNRLNQDSCTNYKSPVWADVQAPVTQPPNKPDPDFETLQQQNSSTAYVIGGVISFTLVVAVGVRIAFSKVARRPRNRDINMPRSLVDILRHQSSPVQQGERNNTTVLTTTTSDGRTSKNLYTPILQSKDNRTGNLHHHFNQQGSASSPKHSATIEKELDEYSNYYTSKRRSNNAPPSFHSSQHHLPWGGDYTLGSRGTLPLNGSRPRLHIPASTPNPYPLPGQTPHTSSSFDRPPRRVRSQDQLLALGEGNTLSRLSKNQQHQYYKAMMSTSRSSTSQTLRRGSGMVPTMGRLSHHQKAQSQQNICVTPSMDRHHMIKMNSHPTPGHDHDRSSAAMPGMGVHGGWETHAGHGGGEGGRWEATPTPDGWPLPARGRTPLNSCTSSLEEEEDRDCGLGVRTK